MWKISEFMNKMIVERLERRAALIQQTDADVAAFIEGVRSELKVPQRTSYNMEHGIFFINPEDEALNLRDDDWDNLSDEGRQQYAIWFGFDPDGDIRAQAQQVKDKAEELREQAMQAALDADIEPVEEAESSDSEVSE